MGQREINEELYENLFGDDSKETSSDSVAVLFFALLLVAAAFCCAILKGKRIQINRIIEFLNATQISRAAESKGILMLLTDNQILR